MIADEKVGARGVKVKCKKCGNMIVVKPAPAASATPESAPASTSDMSASSGFGGGGFAGETTQTPAPQGELGGAFNSMFASSQAPADSSESSNGSGAYSNGNGNHAPTGNDAFGFQSSGYGSGGGETDLALGSLEQQSSQAPASTADRAGERVWYVAIEDAQVGPINMAEVEERWDSKEIDEDTLVWKAGMADWIPLVDVQELAYLITERPQASRGAARPAMAASAGASLASSGGLSASSYGGPQEMGDEPSWKPSAASALSSLVQEELVAKKPEAREEPLSAPKGMEGLGIGSNDIFGSGNGAGTPITMGQPAVAPSAPANDPFAGGGSPAWSVPSSRRQGSGMGMKIIMAFMVIAVLGLGGAMAYMFTRPQTVVVQPPPAPTPVPPPVVVKDDGPPAPPPMPTPPPVNPTPNVGKNETKHTGGEHTGTADGGKETPRKGKTKPGDENNPDSLFDNPNSGKQVAKNEPKNTPVDEPKAAPVKEKLEKDDIIDGVKANGSKLGPCVTAARSKDEIQPGRVQFVLDWTINPNGSVTAARLKGPQEVMNTSLPSCFARVMGSWKFPASKNGAPIANFPLPITVH